MHIALDWLSEDPISGKVTPATTQDVTVKINARNLPVGLYRANIIINNNDPLNNPKIVPVRLDIITGVNEYADGIPTEFQLQQNYPNPFNPTTRIHFALPQEARVTLKIYNILGQEMTTLIDNIQQAGFRSERWDGNGESGQSLPSGLYFYRIVAAPTNNSKSIFIETRKMILLK